MGEWGCSIRRGIRSRFYVRLPTTAIITSPPSPISATNLSSSPAAATSTTNLTTTAPKHHRSYSTVYGSTIGTYTPTPRRRYSISYDRYYTEQYNKWYKSRSTEGLLPLTTIHNGNRKQWQCHSAYYPTTEKYNIRYKSNTNNRRRAVNGEWALSRI